MKARPRQFVFRGIVDAAAFLIDAHVTGEAIARERVLALWPRATAILRTGSAYFVKLAKPVSIAAHRAPGLPLVQRGGAYAAFDVDEPSLRELGTLPEPTIIRLDRGELTVTRLTSANAVDPAAWIELGDHATAAPDSLAAPPEKPRVAHDPAATDIRQLLPVGPIAEPAKLAGLLKALGKAGDKRSSAATPRSPVTAPPSGGTSSSRWWIVPILVGISAILRSGDPAEVIAILFILLLIGAALFGVVQGVRSVANASPRGVAAARRPPKSAASILQRVAGRGESRLRRLVTRVFAATRLARLIGHAHARYLMKMLAFFDDGNFEDALRHAIPLGGDGQSAGIAFAPPEARSRLSITFGGGGAAYSVPMDTDLYRELQRRYRAAFERLDQLGRVEDAAFVLAELLRANEEAVSYLERKGKLRLAAEVAEARGLAPDLIVRQWLLAGERDRAVAIARVYNAYAPAVKRLEQTRPETAKLLRAQWGEWLAESGHYLAAVEAIWPIGEMRWIAESWIERGIEQGGPTAARMLVWRMTLRPESAQTSIDALLEIFDDDDPDTSSLRTTAGYALLDTSATPAVRLLSRSATRALLRDGLPGGDGEMLRRLVQHSGDAALRADLPTLPRPHLWDANAPLTRIVIEDVDRGTTPIHDVAALHDGRIAVALGEAGVDVVARDGRRIAHFDQPAYALVISDDRDRAIAIAPRGRVRRLARIDFGARRAEYWCDAELHAFARDYDGALWFTSHGNEILAIDATSKRYEALWHNPDFPATVMALARTRTSLGVYGAGEAVEAWQIELPSLALRTRTTMDARTVPPPWPAIVGADGAILCARPPSDPERAHWDAAVFSGEVLRVVADRFDGEAVAALRPRLIDHWLVLEAWSEEGPRILLTDRDRGRLRAVFTLRGATSAAVRLQPGKLTIGDDLGRLIGFDLLHGVQLRDLRI